MKISKIKQKEFEIYSRKLIEWLCDNTDPHCTIIINQNGAELLSGELGIITNDYIND